MRESLKWTRRAAVFALMAVTAGAVLAQSSIPPASKFHTIVPCRLYDSREGDGPFLPGEQRELQVATSCSIPEDAVAIAVNLTAVEPSATGNFSVFPDPLRPSATNALSFKAGVAVAGSGVYPLSGNGLGTLSVLANLSSGQVGLILDVSGYFQPDSGTALQSPPLPVCKHGASVQAVDCWEGGFRLSGSANECFFLKAYREARIRIDFRQGGILKSSTYAYWDGGLAFSFRTSFPFKGSWTWTAVCEACLGRTVSPASGAVTVTNRRTSPILYSRGSLGVDPSGRFLKHQTGMKFFWLGDTAWAAPMRTYSVTNSGATWTSYLTQRVTPPSGIAPPASAPTAGKYSIAQVSLATHVGAGGYTDCLTGTVCLDKAKRSAFTTLARQSAACPQPGGGRKVPGPTSYWNPAYWRNLDQQVYEANQSGVVVVLTGVMDPFGYAPDLADDADLAIFARNLAARMAGFFVIYSVGWDNRTENATYACGSDSIMNSVVNGFVADSRIVTKMKTVGSALDAAAPAQLITTHLGGGTPFFGADTYYHDPGADGLKTPLASSYSYFHREPWLDFHLFQSSQCNTDRASVFQHQGTGTPGGACQSFVAEPQLACVMRRARTMPAKFLSLKVDDTFAGPAVVKPVANGEARYELTVPTGQPPVPDIAYQSRHAGHVTTLSGASGYSGGVFNVGEWRWPADGMGLTGPHAGKSPEQLKYLSLLQEGQVMEWERLRRKEVMLRNAGTDENERSVVAASESNQTIVAYLPERQNDFNLQLAINQSVFVGFDTCRWSKLWWNPVKGSAAAIGAGQSTRVSRACESGEPPPCYTFRFSPPICEGLEARPNDHCDWLLLLQDLGACPSQTGHAQIWSGMDQATGQWGVFTQQLAATGEPVGPLTLVGDLSSSVQTVPRVASAGQGALAVWLAEDSDGEGYGIVGRKLDASGLPVGALLRIGDVSQGDNVSPSVAAVGQSGYIVTWTAYSEDGDQGEVFARYLDMEGSPVTPQLHVNSTTLGEQGHSQVASDSLGNVLIAWESWGQDGDGNGVFARLFDPLRVASEEFQVYQAGPGWQYLTGVELDPHGGFEVTWQVYTSYGNDLGTWGQRISTSGPVRNGSEFSIAGAEGGVGE